MEKISVGNGVEWLKVWTNNLSTTYTITPSSTVAMFIKLEFEEKVSPEEVNEIQFLTNDPDKPTTKVNKLTKLGDSLYSKEPIRKQWDSKTGKPEKGDQHLRVPSQKAIKIAYNQDIGGEFQLTMPDNQKSN